MLLAPQQPAARQHERALQSHRRVEVEHQRATLLVQLLVMDRVIYEELLVRGHAPEEWEEHRAE